MVQGFKRHIRIARSKPWRIVDMSEDIGSILQNWDYDPENSIRKVVDENGRPLLVYHGTRRSFDALQISKPRGAPGNPEGIYFTADRRVAEEYAMDVDGAWDEKSRVIAAYIRIESESDGKIIDSSYSGREYVVFGSDNIHVMPKCAPKELG